MRSNMASFFRKRSFKLLTVLLFVCSCGYIHYCSYFLDTGPTHSTYNELDTRLWSLKLHFSNVDTFFRNRQAWPGSKLGGILFKNKVIPENNPNANRTFVILVWTHWDWLKNRHVYQFGSSQGKKVNALSHCSVKNCIFSGDDELLNTADAVVVHLQKGLIPEVENRNPKQRWIFLTDESPKNTFHLSKRLWKLEELDKVFNWSMSYRSDADVPVPYGRTIPREYPVMQNLQWKELAALVPNWRKKRRDVVVTVLMSNCGIKPRNEFLANFRKYVKVDVYGECSDKKKHKKSCPGHFKADCKTLSKYKFYLVLENSKCFQYMTEKLFYNAYSKGAVPIVWGPAFDDDKSLLPPNSFIYVDNDTNIESLARDIKDLNQHDDLMLSMHKWRNHFEVVNEHGYFGTRSYHLCRLCQAMNYNDRKEKIYSTTELRHFLDPSQSCYDDDYNTTKIMNLKQIVKFFNEFIS